MRTARAASVAAIAAVAWLLLTPRPAFPHGGEYQSPPAPMPDPPPPPPGRPPTPGPGKGPTGPGTGGPQGPVGGGPSGPQTGGGGGPPTGGSPSGPPTGGSYGPSGPTRPPRPSGGPDPDHWSRWWYINRVQLLGLRTRVGDHRAAPATPGREGASAQAPLWRAEAQRALLVCLSDPDEDIASGAAVALGRAGDPGDAAALTAVLRDPARAQQVREASALGLGLLPVEDGAGESRVVRLALEQTAADEREPTRLRAMAVYGLGLRADPGSLPFLMGAAATGGSGWDVPAAAVTSLGLSRQTITREDLERFLEGPKTRRDQESIRRVYAAHALSLLGGTESIPYLRDAAVDRDDEVRRASLLALGVLARPDDESTLEVLIHALHAEKDRPARNAAALSLGRFPIERAARELKWAYDTGDAMHQPFAALALGLHARTSADPSIRSLLRRELEERANADLRSALCVAAALSGDAGSLPALRKITSERGDPEVRAHAAFALGLLDDREGGSPILRELLRGSSQPSVQREAAIALGMLGDREALKILLDLVEDGGSVYVQGSAAVALGRIGGGEASDALLALLRDERRPGIARGLASVGLGLLLDRTEGRSLARIGADLDWYALTPAVREVLDIL